jgi:hypothetical protein
VQGFVEERHRRRRIAERRVRGHVLDAFAVDVDFAAVAQRFQKLGAVERALLACDEVFRTLGHGGLPFFLVDIL